jgi:hypothetical protein
MASCGGAFKAYASFIAIPIQKFKVRKIRPNPVDQTNY